MSEKKNYLIKYTNRDKESIKRDLEEYAKIYYPDTVKDFSQAGFPSLMLDTVSYIGDVLSFYLDYEVNENYLDTAVERKNIVRKARSFGYVYDPTSSSNGIAAFYVEVPAVSGATFGPDVSYLPKLKKGTVCQAENGGNFILVQDVEFNSENSEITVSQQDPSTGRPTFYAVKTYGEVISGFIKEATLEVFEFERFKKIRMNDLDVAEILSVVDSEGNEYYEVSNLSQDVVYKSIANTQVDKNVVPEVIKPVSVPRRFMIFKESGYTVLVFGGSSSVALSEDNIKDPARTIYQRYGKSYTSDFLFDPTDLVVSDNFGIGPSNTTLTIRYRVSDPVALNVTQGSLNRVVSPKYEFTDITSLVPSSVSSVVSSFEVENEENIVGQTLEETVEELKQRVYGAYSAQGRCVSSKDYETLAYNMPAKFGKIKRIRAINDINSRKNNINLYVISELSDGTLTSSTSTLKRNLKQWLLGRKMITDSVDILDAYIVNLKIEFKIIADPTADKYDALENALERVREGFGDVPQVGEAFRVSDVYRALREADGVLDVIDVRVSNLQGGNYSDTSFNVRENTTSDGREIVLPRNAVYEIKFLDSDIKGVIV